jgi:hypothetical protein
LDEKLPADDVPSMIAIRQVSAFLFKRPSSWDLNQTSDQPNQGLVLRASFSARQEFAQFE